MLRPAAKMHDAECPQMDRAGEFHRATLGHLEAKTELPHRLWEAAGAQANCLHRFVGITSVPAANLGTGRALKI